MTIKSHELEISGSIEKPAQRSNALQREWELLSSLLDTVADGFRERVKSAGDHYVLTALEIVGGFAAGAAMAMASAQGAKYISRIFVAGAGLDIFRRFAVPMYDAWKNPDHLEQDKKVLGNNIGSALFDYPLMAVSGGLGMAGGIKLNNRLFAFKLTENTDLGANNKLNPKVTEPTYKPIEHNLSEIANKYHIDGKLKYSESFNADGYLTSRIHYNYDAENKLTSKEFCGSEGKVIAQELYHANGKLLRRTGGTKVEHFDIDGKLTSYENYVRDDDFKIVASEVHDPEGNITSFKTFIRDNDGKIVHSEIYDPNDKLVYSEVYSPTGKLDSAEFYDAYGEPTLKCFYDAQGYLTNTDCYDPKGNITSSKVYIRDSKGYITSSEVYENGKLVSTEVYDAFGRTMSSGK